MSAATARPPAHTGLRHVALFAPDLNASLAFYRDLLGMSVEWNPDPDNWYLTSGNDNLALHQGAPAEGVQRLDHVGFLLDRMEHVDTWHDYLNAHEVPILQAPKTHRDGARSFYCRAPEGTTVQFIFHPPLVGTGQTR
ncbi:MAG: VOC family protein [Pseudomonadales bacterium]|jgi:catechol 2,3-dioxygenase-like lactoylglutathione lyase family enzyme